MSSKAMKLYSSYMSSATWRVRIVLAIKGIEYEYQTASLHDSEEKREMYRKVNPMMQVPTLVVGEHRLTQSVNIFEFLEESYPNKPLLPKDIYKRAKVREIAEIINAGIQPLQNLGILIKLPTELQQPFAAEAIHRGFTALETLLAESSGRYCVGDDLSWADCCLVPQINNADRYGVDASKYPTISRIGAELSQLAPFQAAHPTQQPDYPRYD